MLHSSAESFQGSKKLRPTAAQKRVVGSVRIVQIIRSIYSNIKIFEIIQNFLINLRKFIWPNHESDVVQLLQQDERVQCLIEFRYVRYAEITETEMLKVAEDRTTERSEECAKSAGCADEVLDERPAYALTRLRPDSKRTALSHFCQSSHAILWRRPSTWSGPPESGGSRLR